MSKDRKTPKIISGDSITITRGNDGINRITHIESVYKFAFELRNSARVMVNSAQALEESPNTHWQLRAFINGAIILSYASLEAALSEIIHLCALEPNNPLNAEERKVIYTIGAEGLQKRGESNTLQQYNLLLRIIGKPILKSGEAPYQTANLVRELRNELVHPTPGRVVTLTDSDDFDYSSQQEIVKKFRSHLKLSKDATFPIDVLTKECASWAVKSCEAFLHEFVVVSGISIGFITDK